MTYTTVYLQVTTINIPDLQNKFLLFSIKNIPVKLWPEAGNRYSEKKYPCPSFCATL